MPQIHASNSHKFMVCLCSPFKYVHSKNQVLKYTIYEIRFALMKCTGSSKNAERPYTSLDVPDKVIRKPSTWR